MSLFIGKEVFLSPFLSKLVEIFVLSGNGIFDALGVLAAVRLCLSVSYVYNEIESHLNPRRSHGSRPSAAGKSTWKRQHH